MKYKSPYEGPWADPKHLKKLPTGEWRSKRPVAKVTKCRQCGWCFIFCPVGSIKEKDTHFMAHLDQCKGCGTCAQVCPAHAITMVKEEEGSDEEASD